MSHVFKVGDSVRVPHLKGRKAGTIIKQINDRGEEPRFYVKVGTWTYSLPDTWLAFI